MLKFHLDYNTHLVKIALNAVIASLGFSANQGFAVSFEEALRTLSSTPEAARLDDAQVDAADAKGRAAWQVYLPQVSASAYQSKLNTDDRSLRGADLNVDLNLFRFGADRADATANFTAGALANQQRDWNLHEREYAAARKLVDLIYALKIQRVEAEFLAIQEKTVRLTDALYKKGIKSSQDLASVSVDLAQQRGAVAGKRIAVEKALSAIYASGSDFVKIDASWDVDWPWQDLVLSSAKTRKLLATNVPAKGKTQILAELERDDAKAQYRKALSRGLPSLDLNYNKHWDQVEDVPGSQHTWRSSLTLTVPLYQRGLNAAERAESHARVVSAENAVIERERQRRYDLAFLKTKLSQLAEQVLIQRNMSHEAQKLYDNSLAGYQKGVMRVNDLTTDQVRLLNSQKLVLEQWYDLHLAVIELCSLIEQSVYSCVSVN